MSAEDSRVDAVIDRLTGRAEKIEALRELLTRIPSAGPYTDPEAACASLEEALPAIKRAGLPGHASADLGGERRRWPRWLTSTRPAR